MDSENVVTHKSFVTRKTQKSKILARHIFAIKNEIPPIPDAARSKA
jgi:hypothetical protein